MRKNVCFVVLFLVLANTFAQNLYVPGGRVNTSLTSGRVGLGTSQPDASIVAQTRDQYLMKLNTTDGQSKFSVNKRGALSLGKFQSLLGNNDEMLLITNTLGSSTYARIDANTSNAYWIANGKNHGAGLIIENNNQAKAFIFWSKSSGQGLVFDETSSAGNEMIIKNGNVGIGTSNTTYKLNVNGNIRAKGIIVESDWADFVFEDDYRLRPLAEVEKYIKENKRLPEMPSAKEIQKKGFEVAETSTLLLQKIEELTLYIIEQNKRIKTLEQENKEIKSLFYK